MLSISVTRTMSRRSPRSTRGCCRLLTRFFSVEGLTVPHREVEMSGATLIPAAVIDVLEFVIDPDLRACRQSAQLPRHQGGCCRFLSVEELLDGADVEGARE